MGPLCKGLVLANQVKILVTVAPLVTAIHLLDSGDQHLVILTSHINRYTAMGPIWGSAVGFLARFWAYLGPQSSYEVVVGTGG